MTVLYILAAVAAFFALILFSRVHLRFVYEGAPKLKIRFWFVSLDLMKLIDRRKKSKKTEKKKKTTASAHKAAPDESKKKKRSFDELIDFVGFITRFLKRLLKELFSRLRIRIRTLRITVGASEPHVTAALYGSASAAVYQLCEAASRFLDCRCDYRGIGISPDFIGASFSAECDADFSVRVADVLSLGSKALKTFVKLKSEKGDTKDERNTVEAGN